MASPYFVNPLGGADVSGKLAGLGAVLKDRRDDREKQAQLQAAQEEMTSAIDRDWETK